MVIFDYCPVLGQRYVGIAAPIITHQGNTQPNFTRFIHQSHLSVIPKEKYKVQHKRKWSPRPKHKRQDGNND